MDNTYNNSHISEIAQKQDKLASAAYLITSFFDDKEPLKWRIRSLAADLVSDNIKDKSRVVREILCLFSVAKNAGLVSDTNYEILNQELSKFIIELEKPAELLLSLSVPIKTRIPETTLPERREVSQNYLPEETEQNFIKDKNDDKSPLREFGAVSVKKNSRQSTIIGLLKRKKEIMIKDVSPLISGCSEKTIQRELIAMVQAGILKKVGEKRWSRYSLA